MVGVARTRKRFSRHVHSMSIFLRKNNTRTRRKMVMAPAKKLLDERDEVDCFSYVSRISLQQTLNILFVVERWLVRLS